MNVDDFVKAGFKFSYCDDCCVREIPSVQDVLYALRLSDKQEYYEFSMANHSPYIANVHHVAAALDVALMPYDETTRRELIACVILALCPDEAKCVHYSAYTELLHQANLPVHKFDPQTCPCPNCVRERSNNKLIPEGGWAELGG